MQFAPKKKKNEKRETHGELNAKDAKYRGIPAAILPGSWEIRPLATEEDGAYNPERLGAASINMEKRIMSVPDSSHPSAWAARQHEWGHLEASPVEFASAARKAGVNFRTLNAAEDGRINITKRRIFQSSRGRDCMSHANNEGTRKFIYGDYEEMTRAFVTEAWDAASYRTRLERISLAVAKFGMWRDDEIMKVMKAFPVNIAREIYSWYQDWESEDLSVLGTPIGYGQAIFVAQRMEELSKVKSMEETDTPPPPPPPVKKGEDDDTDPPGPGPTTMEEKDDGEEDEEDDDEKTGKGKGTGEDDDENGGGKTPVPPTGKNPSDGPDDGDGPDGVDTPDDPSVVMPDFNKPDPQITTEEFEEMLTKHKGHNAGAVGQWISDDDIVKAVKGSEYYATSKSLSRGRYNPAGWGPCAWVTVPLTKPQRKELRNHRGSSKPKSKMSGGMWRAHKILTTGEIYKRRKPANSAAFCFDMSGSMSVTRQDIVDVLKVSPRAEIIGYCDAVLFYLARKGKVADWDALNNHPSIKLGWNGCDGEALDWLGKQDAQLKVWISDGGVHGNMGGGGTYESNDCRDEAVALVGTYKIRQVLDLDEFQHGLTTSFIDYKPGVVAGVLAAHERRRRKIGDDEY